MRNRTKKMLALLLVGVMAIAMTGCGKKASDTVRWINTTYVLLTEANKGSVELVGGFAANDTYKQVALNLLDQSWDITSREELDATIEQLLTEGSRAEFATEYASVKEVCDAAGISMDGADFQMMLDAMDADSRAYVQLIVEKYAEKGELAIAGWDYCRVEQLYGYGYLAGFYTYEEALEQSLEVAKTIQSMFSSWDELMQSYIDGYQYWCEDDITNPESASYARKQIYEDLKNGNNNPFAIDWNTELVKDWE